jgi:eukaryotic-like serine/threonine-protein kinase
MGTSLVRDIFDRAFELPRSEWSSYLEAATQDQSVRDQVLRLLEAAHDDGTDFLNRPPVISTARQDAVATGRRLGPYIVEAEVGRGGMGVVYRATRADDAFSKTVAIKTVSFGIPQDSFRRERQILATLEHPNIARLLDGGATDDGVLYLVMEMIGGERLDAYAESHQLSIKDRIRLLLPVCDAVSYAHRNLVIHRDLKPANILVTSNGTPKLLDFGVAKVFTLGADGNAANAGADTRTLALTVDYASPEQIRGEQVTTVSDVYSLGVVAYELLTRGARPYRTASSDPITVKLRAILEDEPVRPVAIHGELSNILLKALAKEPAQRYPSVEQFRADLVAHLEGRPVWAQPGGVWYRARKTLRRHWLPIGAAAAVVISSTVGAIAFLQQARVAEDRQRTAEAASQRAESLLLDKEQLLARQASLLKEQVRLRDKAESEAKIAGEQRAIADKRFQLSQRLAKSMLFEVHDAIKNTQGTAESRARVIQRTLPELEALLRESPNDVNTRITAAAAYERLGDLAGGVRGEGSQGTRAGLEYFTKALALLRTDPNQDPKRLAILQLKTGTLEFARNRQVEALALLNDAEQSFSRITDRSGELASVEIELLFNLCQIRSVAGHKDAARTCSAMADKMNLAAAGNATSAAARQERIEAFFRMAILAHGKKEVLNAIRLVRLGVAESTHLMKELPSNTDLKRTHSLMLVQYANWVKQLGNDGEVEAYEEALKICRILRAADPKQYTVGLNHGFAAMQLAVALHKRGRMRDARSSVEESLAVFEELLRAPKAGWMEYNDSSQNLLYCPFADLCNPRKALEQAETAMKQAGPNVYVLDTLARAYARNGEAVKAVEAVRKAQALSTMMPKAIREEIDARVREYEAVLGKP